ncbi:ZP3 protein, partial [Polypterus senegalus]
MAAAELFGCRFQVYRNGQIFYTFRQPPMPLKHLRLTELVPKGTKDELRDYLFYLAVANYRLKEYEKGLKYIRTLLKNEPNNNQALELEKLINNAMKKGIEGVFKPFLDHHTFSDLRYAGNKGLVSGEGYSDAVTHPVELMLGDEIVYSFTLDYNPSQIDGLPIVRTNPALVQIECYYPRRHNVSSNPLSPTWVPYTSTKSAEDILGFSLAVMSSKLLTLLGDNIVLHYLLDVPLNHLLSVGDWSGPSLSNTFFLGDLINLQASVDTTNHVPLRIFVDSCVATPGSNASAPAYTFIGNNGCFVDSKLTSSNSQFMSPRIAPSLMQFKLDAFRFYGLTISSLLMGLLFKVIDSFNYGLSPKYAVPSKCLKLHMWNGADHERTLQVVLPAFLQSTLRSGSFSEFTIQERSEKQRLVNVDNMPGPVEDMAEQHSLNAIQ